MAIPFPKYVEITSGLGANTPASRRDLIGRFFTTSIEEATNAITEYTSLASVGLRFGTDSEEYRKAAFYFGFVDKSISSPSKISFARWADSATAPTILGKTLTSTLTQLQAVTTGQFSLTMGSVTQEILGLDFSSDTSFTEIATNIQTVVRASVVNDQFDTAVVLYNAVKNRFELAGGVEEADSINIVDSGSSGVIDLLGWNAGAILSNGVEAQTITEILTSSTELSNNFGSFSFIPVLNNAQIIEGATWNNTNNLLFMFHVQVLPTDALALKAAIIDLNGTGITLNTVALQSTQSPEILPMAAFAATDYTRRASVKNYMYLQANLTPTVTTSTASNLYDENRINYYGQTQSAGQNLSFYQRGFLTGSGTSPINMNVFANEIWLKDAAGTALINLLLALPYMDAGNGRSIALTILRGTIDEALLNGVISVGKILSTTDKIFIEQQTGDPNAWRQVQTSGFWLDAEIIEEVVSGVTEFIASYTLIYSKSDVIRKIEGTHTLI